MLKVDPDDQPVPNPNRTFTQFLHYIAPGMVASNATDVQGFHPLVNTTPALIDYLGPGAKPGNPLHRCSSLWTFVLSVDTFSCFMLNLRIFPRRRLRRGKISTLLNLFRRQVLAHLLQVT